MCFGDYTLSEIEEFLQELETSDSVSDIRNGIVEAIVNIKIKEDEFYVYIDYDLYEDDDIHRLKQILQLWLNYVRKINNRHVDL